MWRHKEKTAIYKPTKEVSEEINPDETLILDFKPPELQENKYLFKPPSLWNFAAAALANY